MEEIPLTIDIIVGQDSSMWKLYFDQGFQIIGFQIHPTHPMQHTSLRKYIPCSWSELPLEVCNHWVRLWNIPLSHIYHKRDTLKEDTWHFVLARNEKTCLSLDSTSIVTVIAMNKKGHSVTLYSQPTEMVQGLQKPTFFSKISQSIYGMSQLFFFFLRG